MATSLSRDTVTGAVNINLKKEFVGFPNLRFFLPQNKKKVVISPVIFFSVSSINNFHLSTLSLNVYGVK
jgi:hypothetical protein